MATLVGEAAVRIVPSFENFRKRLEAELKSVNKHLDIEVRPQVGQANARLKAWRERQEANKLNIDVDVDVDSLRNARTELKRTEHVFKKSPLRQALVVGVAVTGASALPALADGAASATTAITSLAQASAILPGILAGVLSSVGVLAAGFGGVGKALQEMSTHQATAADTARDYEKANRDLARTQRDYNDAVKEAYRNLQDLKLELKGSSLSQADALISLREAERDYYKGGFKDALDQQRAWLGVLQAKQRVDETTLKNTRTNEDAYSAMDKGVSSADNVVDALDRVADATKKLTESTQGTQAYQKALAALSPAGREFAEQLFTMKGAWEDLSQALSQPLLDHLAADLKTTFDSLLPVLQSGGAKIATGLNATMRNALGALGTPGNKGLLDSIFGNTAGFWQNLSKGMQPFVDGLLRLSQVGATFLPRIGEAFSVVLDRFNTFIQTAADDGSLSTWIDRGLNALNTLGDAVLDVFSLFNSVSEAYRAVSGDQNGLIDQLGRGLDSLAGWAKSQQGQTSLIGYFSQAKEFIDSITPGVKAIVEALGLMGNAARDVFEFLSPILSTVNDLLGENTSLIQIAITAYLGFKLVTPVVSGLFNALGFVNKAAQVLPQTFTKTTLPGLSQLQTALGNTSTAVGAGGIRGSGVGKGLSGAIGGLGALLGPAGLLMLAIPIAIGGLSKLSEAHNLAKKAADDQNTALKGLSQTMDAVSGAATKAGRETVAQTAQDFQTQNYGKRNILQDAQRAGVNPDKLISLTDPTQQTARQSTLAELDAKTLAAVEKSPEWQRGKDKWQAAGIDSKTMALAAAGDQPSIDKVTAAENKMAQDAGIYEADSPDWAKASLGQAARAANILPPTLTDIGQSAGTPDSATTAEFLRRSAGARTDQGAAAQERARAAGGRNRLNPAGQGMFGAFAPSGDAAVVNGQVTQVLDRIPDAATLAAWNEKGITSLPLDNGRIQISFPQSAFPYVEGYRNGGILGGIGTGTSDSNLIRASKGEAVIPADSVASNRDMVDGLIAGHYSGGGFIGPVKPIIPPQVGTLPTPGSGQLGNQQPGGVPNRQGIIRTDTAAKTASLPSWAVPRGVPGTGPAPIKNDLPDWAKPKWAPDTEVATLNPGRVGQRVFNPANRINTPTSPFASGSVNQSFYESWYPKPAAPAAPKLPAKAPLNHDPVIAAKLRSQGLDNFGKPLAATRPVPAPVIKNPGTPHIPAAGPSSPGQKNYVPQIGTLGTGPLPGPANSVAGASPYGAPSVGSAPALPSRTGSESGLQRNTVQLKRAIEAQFPEIATIGGVREDALKWHPSGLALDVMLPGGLTANTPEGKALGDKIWAWAQTEGPKYGLSTDPGVNIWNDGGAHDNHLHLVSTGGGAQDGTEQYTVPGLPNAPILGPNGAPIDPSTPPASPFGTGPLAGLFSKMFPLFGQPQGTGATEFGSDGSLSVDGRKLPDSIQPAKIAASVGQIGMQLLGGFLGIDLSQITGPINTALGSGGSDGDSAGTGQADPDAASLLNTFGSGASPGEGFAYPTGAGTSSSGAGGAEQYRGLATQIVSQLAPQYGITNIDGWVSDILGQIQFESGGKDVDNLNDSNGQGGTQQVYGLGQFLPSTFDAHNIAGGSIRDPAAVIAAMVDYVSSKYGMDADGSPAYINEGHGYKTGGWALDPVDLTKRPPGQPRMGAYIRDRLAMGGMKALEVFNGLGSFPGMPGYADGGFHEGAGRVRGGGGKYQDRVNSALSPGEHVSSNQATGHYPKKMFDAINARQFPMDAVRAGLNGGTDHRAMGGWGGISLQPLLAPPPGPNAASGNPGAPAPTPVPAPPPPAAGTANAPSLPGPAPTPLGTVGASGAPGATAPAPNGGAPLPQPSVQDQAGSVLGALGGVGGGGPSQPGAEAPEGASSQADPRSVLGSGPASNQHLGSGIKAGIEGAFQAAGNAGAAAAGAAGMAVPGVGAASSLISGGAQVAGQVASGIANVVASGLVGTMTPGSTAGAYGTPLLPAPPTGNQGTVPAIQNTYNGGISVGNYEQFDAGQRRREAQNAMPFLNAK